MTRIDILNMEISLPIKKQDTIDFMETCIRELSAYLSISGLDNYELNVAEKKAIKRFHDNDIRYKIYKLGEGDERLFDISSPQKRFNANTVTFDGKYPYVVRSSLNNGIRGYITQDECYLNPAKTISFGQDTATIFYQEKPFKILHGVNLHLMKKLKNMEISLPVNSNNNIDYTYISTFIKAQEKLSIKNIID